MNVDTTRQKKRFARRTLLGALCTVACVPVRAWGPGTFRPEIMTVQSVTGEGIRPFGYSAVYSKAIVFFFVARECPISNQYAPEIGRICREYTGQGVQFYVVYTESDTKPEAARKHAEAFGYPCPALVDSPHRLVRFAGATVTPEVGVFSPHGKRLYRGRIDDRYPALGQRRVQLTSQDLRQALNAVLRGQKPDKEITQAVGCAIVPVKP
jgi:thiol-disulfide isomerase/thioredoxin